MKTNAIGNLTFDELTEYGWNVMFERAFGEFAGNGTVPARVLEPKRGLWSVVMPDGSGGLVEADIAPGKYLWEHPQPSEHPSAGDWVCVRAEGDSGVLKSLLPRISCFSRKASNSSRHDPNAEQVLAANIDFVFLASAGNDFNVRRLERYITLSWESGAQPVVVITKADVAEDIDSVMRRAHDVAIGVPVVATSALDGSGLEALGEYLKRGKTATLLGSSGAGKSTLLNALAGSELQETREVKDYDKRGRHTTSSRCLIKLPSGALMIDTPGMRELQLYAGEDSVQETYSEIEELAVSCRFRDCGHEDEPGCAVKSALENGILDAGRYEGYMKLKKEVAYLSRREDKAAFAAYCASMKKRARMIKVIKKHL